MTMMEASGTSTPTSITVVATSTWVSPLAKAAMALSRSAGFILPWDDANLCAQNLLQRRVAFFDGGDIELFALRNKRTDPICARAACHSRLQPRDDIADAVERQRAGFDRLAPRGLLAQGRDIHVAE